MPRAFVQCVKAGGRVRTITPNRNTTLRVCIRNGHSYPGHVHRRR